MQAEAFWQEQLTKQMESHIENAIELSKQLGLASDEVVSLFDLM